MQDLKPNFRNGVFFISIFYFSQMKIPALGGEVSFLMQVSISRILLSIVIYLGLMLPLSSSDSSVLRQTRSCTRVSILPFHPRLNVGIRHCSQLYPCGRRALPATFAWQSQAVCSDFPHSNVMSERNYPAPAQIVYRTCFFISSMLYSICECEVILTFIVNNISAAKNAFGRFLFNRGKPIRFLSVRIF